MLTLTLSFRLLPYTQSFYPFTFPFTIGIAHRNAFIN